MNKEELLQDLREFITTLPHQEKGNDDNSHAGTENYSYADDYEECPTYGLDFNRDLIPPNTSTERPEGIVGIRVDEDFFLVAILPWKYHELNIQEIVQVLWPRLYNKSIFRPDSSYNKPSDLK